MELGGYKVVDLEHVLKVFLPAAAAVVADQYRKIIATSPGAASWPRLCVSLGVGCGSTSGQSASTPQATGRSASS